VTHGDSVKGGQEDSVGPDFSRPLGSGSAGTDLPAPHRDYTPWP
jgi:hypothetical protein